MNKKITSLVFFVCLFVLKVDFFFFMKDTKEQNVLCRFCLSHILLFIIKVQFAYQRSFVSAWQRRQQRRRHWLVSDGATDGSVVVFCKCTNTVCALFVSEAVQRGAG